MARVIFTHEPQEFIAKLAEALKGLKEFEKPEWVSFVKSGVSKARPPMSDDFWHTRAASILRQLYIRGVVGVGKLRTKYGAKKNRGGQRSKFFKASGKIIRTILQQAEAAGLVERVEKLQHGRRLTVKGREFLDSIKIEEKPEFDTDSFTVADVENKIDEDLELNENSELNEDLEETNNGEQEGDEKEQ